MEAVTVLMNGTVITPVRGSRWVVLIEGDRQRRWGPSHRSSTEAEVIDVKGIYQSGFIDLRFTAPGAAMFRRGRRDRRIAAGLVRGGRPPFLTTTSPVPDRDYQAVGRSANNGEEAPGAKFWGAFEGRTSTYSRRVPRTRSISLRSSRRILTLGEKYSCIKRVSAAPELRALNWGRNQRRGLRRRFYSEATYQDVLKAIETDTPMSPIYSAMSGTPISAYRVSV